MCLCNLNINALYRCACMQLCNRSLFYINMVLYKCVVFMYLSLSIYLKLQHSTDFSSSIV